MTKQDEYDIKKILKGITASANTIKKEQQKLEDLHSDLGQLISQVGKAAHELDSSRMCLEEALEILPNML